jgi:hypothetical protein
MNNSKSAGQEVSNVASYETPESEYVRRLQTRQRQLASVEKLHRRLWTYLLPSVVALRIFWALGRNARLHRGVGRIVGFCELGIARLRNQWQGRGTGGEELRPATHAFASDLDLFGTGSLFELLCTARTGIGRAMLANWLLNPALAEEIAERQAAIIELRGAREWVQAPAITIPFYARALAALLPICAIILALLGGAGIWGPGPVWAVAVPIALEALLAMLLRKKTRLITSNLVLPLFELEFLTPLLLCLGEQCFQCPLLKSLQLEASIGGPSKRIRLLHVWGWLLHLRQFEYFAVLASPFLWGTNLAILIERWRQRNHAELAQWLSSLGQFEALLCLARYYYENPDHTFAGLKGESPALFEAEDLGHPLLDRQTCVRCDVRLGADKTQLMVVSGSNMSGKSTLLRSVGLNTVLAMAGAPVRATRFQISRLLIGCSIAVHDSLLTAKSRFHAEVERLTGILTLSRTNNLLFLLDEVLGGTNSADRLFGVRAVIEQLLASGAVGIVTTHDLALTEVANDLDGRAINVHFEEHYKDGEMRFDYRMRPGVLTRTNGINVMAALGLLPGGLRGENR